MVTVRDIAILAETSVATVSRVLNDDPHVAQSTLEKVRQVIETTGYKPKRASKASPSRKGKILVLLPSLNNPFFFTVLEGVEHKAVACGYNTLVCITHRDDATERNYLNMAVCHEVDGVISFISALPDEETDAFAAKYPFIQCGATINGPHISNICIDDAAAAFDAVTHLIKLGHRRIAFVTGLTKRPFEIKRKAGYLNALSSHAIPYVPDYTVKCNYTYSDSYQCMEKLMELHETPTAVFASSDLTALGVLKYMHDHNLTPAKDIDLIGFDGTYLTKSSAPSISVIEQPGYEMGKAAVDMLMEKISDINFITKKIVMTHKLILRETTRNPGEAVAPNSIVI